MDVHQYFHQDFEQLRFQGQLEKAAASSSNGSTASQQPSPDAASMQSASIEPPT
jgi:hypothetical protein